jgi:hypothetical protein
MCQIVKSAETFLPDRDPLKYYSKLENSLITESLGHCCYDITKKYKLMGKKIKIICLSKSG